MSTLHHRDLGLSDQQVIDMYFYMLLARRLDERSWLLFRMGKIPFVVSCQGHEGAQIGAAFALDPKNDVLLPYYRDLGMVLVFGMTPTEIMLSNFAKAADPNSGGRQMPGHYGCKRLGIITGSSPVTTQVPHAAGVALAMRMQKQSNVVLTCFGEGSSNQGDFHEGLNFAGVHGLPVIFLCQNNQLAISTPIDKQISGGSVVARANAYGIKGEQVDGTDVLEVYRVVKEAIKRCRANQGPTLIEASTYRLTPHTSNDDDSIYRSKTELELAKAQDPLPKFADYLNSTGTLYLEQQDQLEDKIQQLVDEAVKNAESAEYPSPESALEHVYECNGVK